MIIKFDKSFKLGFCFLIMVKDCIFCKIARGEIPSDKIYEDEEFLGILDAFPVIKGQILVIPKKHVGEYLFDMPNKDYSKLLLIAKKIAKAIDFSLKPIKTGMLVEGLEVNHIHIKLFPFFNKFGLKLKTLNPKPSDEEMKDIAEKIKVSLNENS